MNMDQFIAKYGYVTAPWMIRIAVQISWSELTPAAAQTLRDLADDLEGALKSLEGKIIP